ncbi:hypothetical protein [Magnetococcus sp. PR-3]|uniref:hypothetical protein n=1 Tax=Magnetococcus sp. PR-3 TaxID=3120355 RepID=UPI002FCE0711
MPSQAGLSRRQLLQMGSLTLLMGPDIAHSAPPNYPAVPCGAFLYTTVQGESLVLDIAQSHLTRYDTKGNKRWQVGKAGTRPGQLTRPCSVASLANGYTVVLDAGNQRLQAWNQAGHPIQPWLDTPPLRQPVGALVTDGDKLAHCDRGDGSVRVWSDKGRILATLKQHGPTALKAPSSLTLDPNQTLWVLDPTQRHLLGFNGPLWQQGVDALKLPDIIEAPLQIAYSHQALYVVDGASRTLYRHQLDQWQKVDLPAGLPVHLHATSEGHLLVQTVPWI